MINRTLSRRLERLEEQMIPTGEPKVIHVVFINPDGTQAPGTFTVEIPAYSASQHQRRGAPPPRMSSQSRGR
jgi:hypothetical protein